MHKDLSKVKLLILDVDGTLTDGGIYINDAGEISKKFNVKDGMGIKIAMEAGLEVGIISHSSTKGMVEARASMLAIQHLYIGKEPKLKILKEWVSKLELDLDQVAYIGDDVNDLDVLQSGVISACPIDAIEIVVKSSDIVLSKPGGQGAVREFIDEYLLPAGKY